jgi:putative ABC transport system permease protein
METLLQDIRYALRTLKHTPAFTTFVVLVMAVGIGTNAALFSFLHGTLVNPLGLKAPDRLIDVNEYAAERGRIMSVSYPDFVTWRSQNRSFEEMAAYTQTTFTLSRDGEPERITGAAVSWSLTGVLGVPPVLGRGFLEEEDRPGAAGAVLLGHELWQRRFGSDPAVLGRHLTIDGEAVTVVGIMPPGFRFPVSGDLWMPLRQDLSTGRGAHNLAVAGRLAPGVTLEGASADMSAVAADLAEHFPDSNGDVTVRLIPLEEEYLGGTRRSILIFYVVVSFILALACANVANLMLARAAARKREVAVRTSIGAGRLRIARMLVTECVLLALAGGAIGLLLGRIGRDLVLRLIPVELPYFVRFEMNLPVIIWLTGIAALCGVLFGLAPVIESARLDPASTLHGGGGQATGGRRRGRFRSFLVGFEVATALVILVGAGLMLKSVVKLRSVEPGFDPERVLTMRLSLPRAEYPGAEQRTAFYRELLAGIRSLPGVATASAAYNPPMGGYNWGSSYYIEGTEIPQAGQYPVTSHGIVFPGLFRTLGIPLLQGRDFDERDDAPGQPVAIVSRRFAELNWPGEDPLGRRLRYGVRPSGDDPWLEVVGVVEDIRQYELGSDPSHAIYRPYAQYAVDDLCLLVKTESEPLAMSDVVRRKIWELDPNLPPYLIRTMEQVVRDANWEGPVYAWLFNVFSLIALLLAAAGVYAVIAYSVVQRTRELGIRLALGASPGLVVRSVVGQGIRLAVIGLAVGLAVALALMRFLAGLLYGVEPFDLPVYALTILVMGAVAILATWLPARRTIRIDPVVALRAE